MKRRSRSRQEEQLAAAVELVLEKEATVRGKGCDVPSSSLSTKGKRPIDVSTSY